MRWPTTLISFSVQHYAFKNQVYLYNNRRGQALAEFIIILVVLITLITGVTTISKLCLQQEYLQRDLRCQAGESALDRKNQGWVNHEPQIETRSDTFHRINSITRLADYKPGLTSKLPMSHYTLEARQIADGDLGLEETKLSTTYLLDEAFIRLVYGKGSVTMRAQLTFPATSGIWK